jgi:hypothetical protein
MITGKKQSGSGSPAGRRLQRGIITTFTGVLILVLLTLMMFFAVRVGVFDQRSSSSEMRQKLAFHTAESAISHAKEFFRANSLIAASTATGILGSNGWLSAASGALRWQKCSAAGLNLASGSGTHPCFGEPNPGRRQDLYYYSFNGSTNVPVDTDTLLDDATETVTVQALLCLLDIDFDATTPVQGCSTNTSDDTADDFVDGKHYMITLLARGRADCVGSACGAESLVREQVSNFGGAAGGQAPSVPLTTKSVFPPSGSAEIVPNPNSGGVGVPVSVWMNANPSCSADGSVIDPSSGSWATCEAQEWYGVDAMPEDYTCPGNCSCSREESISYTHADEDILGIDLVADANFPCDLFQFYFGVPKANYEIVKGFSQVLSDCSTLGPESAGIYWISGSDCLINSNTVVGAPNAPIMLITAAATTELRGGAIIYGILYVSDTEHADAALYSNGTNTVYGQVIVDAQLGSYTGTFQVVYNQNTISQASGQGGLGSVIGGWADFHPNWK